MRVIRSGLTFVALSVAVAAAACTPAPSDTATQGGGRLAAGEVTPAAGPHSGDCKVVKPSRRAQRVDAPWKTRVVKAMGKHSVGVAVGVRGVPVFVHGGRRPRVPASNEKLLLTMALFDRVGPSYRIPTRAEVLHPPKHGVVRGNLWLVGRGDPTLTDHQRFYWGSGLRATSLASLARKVNAAGIHKITGRVIGATSYFAHDLHAPGWHSFVPHEYVEPLTSLGVNGNNTVKHHAELKAAAVLTKELSKRGVTVGGHPAAQDPPRHLERVATVRSEPVETIVRFMDETSNNQFAEMFGKLLGARTFGAPGTIAKGARAIEQWAAAHGVKVVAHDSSGLSFKDRVSPDAIVHLLGAAEHRPWLNALRRVLPAPGQGTLEYRLPGIKVKAKTGTLFAGASALSGWVWSGGRWVEFSILDSNAPKTMEDKIVTILSRAHIHTPPPPHRSCS